MTSANPVTPQDDSGWQRFEVAAANWLLGLTSEEDLRRAANAAVLDGEITPALVGLAGTPQPATTDQLLPVLFAIYEERGLEFPLRDNAIDASFADVLARMLAGSLTPEEASSTLWYLADRQYDTYDREYLEYFKGLGIALDVSECPECEDEFHLDEWRAEMLAGARAALAGIPFEEYIDRMLDRESDD